MFSLFTLGGKNWPHVLSEEPEDDAGFQMSAMGVLMLKGLKGLLEQTWDCGWALAVPEETAAAETAAVLT